MQNLKEDLKAKVHSIIYHQDIADIVLLLRDKLELRDYISSKKPIDPNYDEVHGVSFENAIDYDPSEKFLIINMSVFLSKFTQTYDANTQPYNWMILVYELSYALEDILLTKYQNEKIHNDVTEIISIYNDFIDESKWTLSDYSKFLHNYKSDKTTKNKEIVNPIDRIKMVHAYFNTLDIFKGINIDPKIINEFMSLFKDELLKGYSPIDQNVYPLRNIFFQDSYIDGQFFMGQFSWYDTEVMNAISDATKKVNSLKERLALGYPIDSVDYTLVRKNRI